VPKIRCLVRQAARNYLRRAIVSSESSPYPQSSCRTNCFCRGVHMVECTAGSAVYCTLYSSSPPCCCISCTCSHAVQANLVREQRNKSRTRKSVPVQDRRVDCLMKCEVSCTLCVCCKVESLVTRSGPAAAEYRPAESARTNACLGAVQGSSSIAARFLSHSTSCSHIITTGP
jgi:hypothetical protein